MPPSEAQQDFSALVLACNKDGMDALRQGQANAAFEQFKYAESVLIANQAESSNANLLAVTCNNLGCYYKKVGKFHGALSYLRRALKMEVDLGTDEATLAGTHLNICAILSKLEKHEKAVQHALSALDLIQTRVKSSTEPGSASLDDYSVLAIAYHNVAVERDFLQQYDKAAVAFKEGYQVAKESLGEDHPLSVSLSRNCDAVQAKSQKLTKSAPYAAGLLGAGAGTLIPRSPARDLLPPLAEGLATATATATAKAGEPLGLGGSLRQEAAAWAASAEALGPPWSQARSGPATPRLGMALPSLQQQQQQQQQQQSPSGLPPSVPHAPSGPRPPGGPRPGAVGSAQLQAARPPPAAPARTEGPLATSGGTGTLGGVKGGASALGSGEESEPLMDLVEAERLGPGGGSGALALASARDRDMRPNRVVRGPTRTARVVRRTGCLHSTKHRDLVVASKRSSDPRNSAYVQKMAAERIQRAWRAWYRYCQENADWMTTTWVCATMIQANWRSYRVRRVRLDKAATTIQRHYRGHLARKTLRKHAAAVQIQRHVLGMLTRQRLLGLHRAAVKIQGLVRGGLARAQARKRRALLTRTAMAIQGAVRAFLARRRAQELRAARDLRLQRERAAGDIQRHWRGHRGRLRAAAARAQYGRELREYQAATKLQAMVRRDAAIRQVDQMRAAKLQDMSKAATCLRRMWLGAKARRRYRELLAEFARHEPSVVTIQRFARGFLVRLRLWREAIRAEEELWAVLELQRVWRGYRGRVLWEQAYEEMWRREMAAAHIARHIRGWLARVKISRLRRRIARAEFERARLRFRAAQRLQALARGVLTRKVTQARRHRKVLAAVRIQAIWRGHALRRALWTQVLELRATMLQAWVRGFLVRRRRLRLQASALCIQRCWKRWRQLPERTRLEALQRARDRRRSATIIQRRYSQRLQGRELARIADGGAAMDLATVADAAPSPHQA